MKRARAGSSGGSAYASIPQSEILPLNGTKEGVFLLAFAVVSRDAAERTVVIPTPAYPVYEPAASSRAPTST